MAPAVVTDLANKQQHSQHLLALFDPDKLDAMVPDKDGDTLSPAEQKAIAEAGEWLKQNEPIPHEQVLADLGLSMDDWERMNTEP